MHPVGPLNPKVYWVRRVSIVVLAVAVLIGMVWFLASRTSRSSAGQDTAAAAVNTSAAPTLTGVLAASSGASRSTVPSPSPSPAVPPASGSAVASPAPSPGPATPDPVAAAAAAAAAQAEAAALAAAAAAAPATEAAPPAPVEPPPAPAPEPAPSFDAQGKLICPASAVTVTATTAAPSFAAGSQPKLGMVVTNTGTVACQQDVSGTQQVYTVTAADGSRVWSTTDCFPGEGTEVRELTPGQTVQYTIKWSGTSSAPGCAGDRTVVPAGDYTVVAQLGALSSPPTAFAITG
jgi:hypothetical protein